MIIKERKPDLHFQIQYSHQAICTAILKPRVQVTYVTQWCLTKLTHVHSYFEVRNVVCVIIDRDFTGVSGLLTRQLFKRLLKQNIYYHWFVDTRSPLVQRKVCVVLFNSIILIVYYIYKTNVTTTSTTRWTYNVSASKCLVMRELYGMISWNQSKSLPTAIRHIALYGMISWNQSKSLSTAIRHITLYGMISWNQLKSLPTAIRHIPLY